MDCIHIIHWRIPKSHQVSRKTQIFKIMKEKKQPWILPLGLGIVLLVSMLVAAGIGVIPIPVKVILQSLGQKFGMCQNVAIADYVSEAAATIVEMICRIAKEYTGGERILKLGYTDFEGTEKLNLY